MSVRTFVLTGSVLLSLTLPGRAQQPDSAARATTAPAPPARPLLLKMGTGLTRGFFVGGDWGLAVPVVPGAEYQWRPGWSAYADGFCGLRVLRERWAAGGPTRHRALHAFGFDAGLRYYYHQGQRRQRGRAAGPFVGNYLALQTASAWWRGRYTAAIGYEYTSVTVLWGLQRRLGAHGLLDGYAGLGLWNAEHRRGTFYSVVARPDRPLTRALQPAPELGLKLSLVW